MDPLWFVTWLITFSITCAERLGHEYDVMYGCDTLYGNMLENLNAIRSITECCVQCSKNNRCVSVKYDSANQRCQLNSEGSFSLRTSCSSMKKYAKRTQTPLQKLVDRHCLESTDCPNPLSMCLQHRCQCYHGYSYNYNKDSCVTSCDEYGTTFTAYPDYFMQSKHKFIELKPFETVDNCKRACAEETEFVCVAFDYHWSFHECGLSVDTAMTAPGYYISWEGNLHLVRNCKI